MCIQPVGSYIQGMFGDLYDALSLAWAWTWPTATAEVTAVDVERLQHSQGREDWRLAVAYKFWIGNDGPYTGESFWKPLFRSHRCVLQATRKIRKHQAVPVHYRPDDPSVNKLDREIWREL